MKPHTNNVYNIRVYYRLIALWVICEAFAGGIMHGLKLPFTGLIVSSLAIICIILIAYHTKSGTAILKATVIVAIFKLMLSPHSPPTAYIAVFFQGLLGQVLLNNPRYFKTGAVILAITALVESALQRLLVLLVVYGNNLWEAVNLFIQKITNEKNPTNYSLTIAVIYIILHATAGIFVGIYAVKLARSTRPGEPGLQDYLFTTTDSESMDITPQKNKWKKLKWVFVITWLLLISLYLQSWLQPYQPILPKNIVLSMLIRSTFILLSWYLLIGPMMLLLLNTILRSLKMKYHNEINEVMILVPKTKYIFFKSLQFSEKEKGTRRIKLFFKALLINVMNG